MAGLTEAVSSTDPNSAEQATATIVLRRLKPLYIFFFLEPGFLYSARLPGLLNASQEACQFEKRQISADSSNCLIRLKQFSLANS